MVDREERLVVREGDRLGGHDADHHAADQPGPAGRGDAVEIGKPSAGLGQRLGHQPVEPLEMGAGGDLRHHAAEAAMLGELAVDDIGQDSADRHRVAVGASTTATAVSSQLVSMPRTRMRVF